MLPATLRLIRGDITTIRADAIVNAANSTLLGGGGVDGAIHRAGGPAILEACRRIGYCAVGEAVITPAGLLPARFVIHTVGPVWAGGQQGEAALLSRCYQNALALALANGVETIAFPNISTGVYGYPKAEACRVALRAVRDFLGKQAGIREVLFICFDEENYALYAQALPLESTT